jgi:hypothetical protein
MSHHRSPSSLSLNQLLTPSASQPSIQLSTNTSTYTSTYTPTSDTISSAAQQARALLHARPASVRITRQSSTSSIPRARSRESMRHKRITSKFLTPSFIHPPPLKPLMVEECTRTQEKLQRQRQEMMASDPTSRMHPKNRARLNKELDRVRLDWGHVKRWHDPVQESLGRVTSRTKGV